MNKSNSLVSIIIPTYNRQDLISDSIKSALAQSHADTEILVVDDGSTDDTPQILKPYQKQVTVITQANHGQSAARNAGITKCSGKYVLFLDSDDYLEPFAIEILLEGIQKKEKESLEWGVSYGKMRSCDKNLVPVKYRRKRYYNEDVLRPLFFDNFVRTGTYLVRKSILEEIGGFKEDLVVREDRLLLLSIAARYKFHFIDRFLVKYRRHTGPRARYNVKQNLGQKAQHLDYFFMEAPASLPKEILKVKPKLYGLLYMELFKTAWRNQLWDQALAHFKAAVVYNRYHALHPKHLYRATISALRCFPKK